MEYEDPDKIVELSSLTNHKGKGNSAKGHKDKANKGDRKELFKQIIKESYDEVALEGLTDEERQFGDAIIAGDSLAAAYVQAYPEGTEGENYSRLYQLGSRVSKRPAVRAYVRTRLDEEEGEVSHTSARLNNFILKRLEHEAQTASTPAARLKALELLSKHKAVQASEDLTGAKAKAERSSDELMEEIRTRIDKLTGGKNG